MFFIPHHMGRVDRWVQMQLKHPKKYQPYTRDYAQYRFVDLYRAVEQFCKQFSTHSTENWVSYDPLGNLMSGTQCTIQAASTHCFEVGYDQQQYFPVCSFWSTGSATVQRYGSPIVIKLQLLKGVTLEIAAQNEDVARQIADELDSWSIQNSVYRRQTLHLQSADSPDDYGNLPYSMLDLKFSKLKEISHESIILDDAIREVLRRNVFLFHNHHQQLIDSGVSARRALLFHGPPGTGKTFTGQFIAHQLRDRVTTFIATGQSLNRIEAICQLARLLQPSLVIIEDIDLVFASREINLYSTALGDFMDQLDGLKPDDRVTFLMTTNAIDRVEMALKDRPGRVNQCLYFGPPTAPLREKYLRLYINDETAPGVNIEEVVDMTDGVTQAYLKELYQRAILVSYDHNGFDGTPDLMTRHFEEAHEEMTSQNTKHTASIMGFNDSSRINGTSYAK